MNNCMAYTKYYTCFHPYLAVPCMCGSSEEDHHKLVLDFVIEPQYCSRELFKKRTGSQKHIQRVGMMKEQERTRSNWEESTLVLMPGGPWWISSKWRGPYTLVAKPSLATIIPHFNPGEKEVSGPCGVCSEEG